MSSPRSDSHEKIEEANVLPFRADLSSQERNDEMQRMLSEGLNELKEELENQEKIHGPLASAPPSLPSPLGLDWDDRFEVLKRRLGDLKGDVRKIQLYLDEIDQSRPL